MPLAPAFMAEFTAQRMARRNDTRLASCSATPWATNCASCSAPLTSRMFSVGDRRVEHLLDRQGSGPRGELEHPPGLVHVQTADEVDDPARLERRDPDEAGRGPDPCSLSRCVL